MVRAFSLVFCFLFLLNNPGVACEILKNTKIQVSTSKEIFSPTERIPINFDTIVPEKMPKDFCAEIPYEKYGLIENLSVLNPAGDVCLLKNRVVYPPSGRFHTNFNANYFFDFSRPGLYIVKSRFSVASHSFESNDLKFWIEPEDFCQVKFNSLSSDLDYSKAEIEISINSQEIEQFSGLVWGIIGGEKKYPYYTFSSSDTKIEKIESARIKFPLDFDRRIWGDDFCSMGPTKSTKEFFNKGKERFFRAKLIGRFKGRTFEVFSNEQRIQF